MGITHKENESLKDYFDRLNNDKIYVEYFSNSRVVNAFYYGLDMKPIWFRLVDKIPELSYKEMIKIVEAVINFKDIANHHNNGLKNHP